LKNILKAVYFSFLLNNTRQYWSLGGKNIRPKYAPVTSQLIIRRANENISKFSQQD
jgi:geranylgeranyl pyrophosphate synthase